MPLPRIDPAQGAEGQDRSEAECLTLCPPAGWGEGPQRGPRGNAPWGLCLRPKGARTDGGVGGLPLTAHIAIGNV